MTQFHTAEDELVMLNWQYDRRLGRTPAQSALDDLQEMLDLDEDMDLGFVMLNPVSS